MLESLKDEKFVYLSRTKCSDRVWGASQDRQQTEWTLLRGKPELPESHGCEELTVLPGQPVLTHPRIISVRF